LHAGHAVERLSGRAAAGGKIARALVPMLSSGGRQPFACRYSVAPVQRHLQSGAMQAAGIRSRFEATGVVRLARPMPALFPG